MSAPRSRFRCRSPRSPRSAQVPIGDWAARDVATSQPIKLAAIEGLAKTTREACEHLLRSYTDGR